jgi:aspartate aminotransferase
MNNITISQRAKNTPASAIRKLVPLAEKAKEKGIKVYHLNIGQPDLPTPQEVLDYIHNFTQKTLQYAPSAGIKEAVLSWQKFYADKGMSFEQKDIVVTAGGSEALLFAFMTVCDPGDEILIF